MAHQYIEGVEGLGRQHDRFALPEKPAVARRHGKITEVIGVIFNRLILLSFFLHLLCTDTTRKRTTIPAAS